MIICVPSARRIFAPPSPGACLDGLASNSDAADDRGSLGRSRSLLTLGPTLPYGGRLPAPGCGPEAHEAAPQALIGDGISGRLDVMRRTPEYRRHSGNVRVSPVPGYRPVRRSHRKALCRQPKRPERSSILAPTRHPEKRDGAEFGPFVELDRAIEGILGVTAMQGDAGPTPSREAAQVRRRSTRGSCDGPGR
jgi:hypothetical protein